MAWQLIDKAAETSARVHMLERDQSEVHLVLVGCGSVLLSAALKLVAHGAASEPRPSLVEAFLDS